MSPTQPELLAQLFIPGDTPSTPNLREHWATKAQRNLAVKRKVQVRAQKFREGIPALLTILLVRTGARALDGDNLQGALKAHRDAVATVLKVDDASPLVRWEYKQSINPSKELHGVMVHVWRA